MEGNLPGSPRVVDGWEALPIIYLLQEVLGSEDSGQGRHHQFDFSNGHAGPLCFLLGILHHDNELGDVVCLNIELGHVQAEGNHVNGMQPPAVGIKVGHDLKGRNLHVDSLGVF
jgi:hypothetical protein